MLFIRNVTFMTSQPRVLADFWAEALSLTERRDDENETIIADAEWSYPRLTFQKVGDASNQSRRIHLDLTADNRETEITRLRDLGARAERTVTVADEWAWTVMTDPDGNEFCITDP